ncbi:MAG: hypothetical protein F6K10_12890 [Moorea sp. SIO2B7]|nr:hypothetical protein [Moorena sp. SIO2B7]
MSDDHKQQPEEKEEEKKSPSPSLVTERKEARQFVQGTAQTIIQWMPLGGSGGLLISFLWFYYQLLSSSKLHITRG